MEDLHFVEQFGGSINLNPHFHSLVLDGVYISSAPYQASRFHPLPPPSDEEIAHITAAIARRVEKLLLRKGLLGEDAPTDPDLLEADQPLLSQLYSASVQSRIATGPRAGQRVLRLGDRIDVEGAEAITGPRCASVQGFSLHANVCVPAHDRRRLERLEDDVGGAVAPPVPEAIEDPAVGKLGEALGGDWWPRPVASEPLEAPSTMHHLRPVTPALSMVSFFFSSSRLPRAASR